MFYNRKPSKDSKASQTSLAPFPEKGKLPESRISTVQAAWAMNLEFKTADEISAKNRQTVDACLEGEPPYSPDAFLASGNSYRFNLNFLEGDAAETAALTSYTDLIDSVSCLARLRLPVNAGDPIDRDEMEEVIAEEFHDLVREWAEFDSNWEMLARRFIRHGVSIPYFTEDQSPWWRVGGLDEFRFPRQTAANEEKIEVLCADVPYLPHELYRYIRDESAASKMGWDVDMVKKMLVRATCDKKESKSGWSADWALLQKRLKNNDLEVSHTGASLVHTVHMWVREFNGKISHFILPDNPQAGDEFLCKRVGRYDRATQVFVFFTSGTGNGTYHSVRGQGWKMFPMLQASNRFRNGILDGTNMSMALLLQPKDNAQMDSPPLTLNGPVAFLSPDMDIVARGAMPNVASQAMPVVNDLANLIQNNTGNYRPRSASSGGQERTATEIRSQLEIDSALTVSEVNKFYRSWDRLLREMFIRIQAISPTDKRFPEIVEFYKNCSDRGVESEIVKKVRRVKAVRAIGLGSPQQRQLAFGEIAQMIGSFDEVGRNKLTRDMISNRMDRDAADRYKPRGEATRPVIDEKIAQLENADFREGQLLEAALGENHAVHAKVHIGAMMESVQIMEQIRDAGGELDFDAIQKELQFLQIAIPHTGPHVAEMAQDPSRKSEAASMRQALQNINGIFEGFLRQLQRAIRIQQAQAQEQSDATGEPVNQEDQRKNQEHVLKLRIIEEEHRERMLAREQDVLQKLELNRIKFDEKMAQEVRKATLQNA